MSFLVPVISFDILYYRLYSLLNITMKVENYQISPHNEMIIHLFV
jgi:hypothetical protein